MIERSRLIKFLFTECLARNHSENVFKMFLKFVPEILYIARSQSHPFCQVQYASWSLYTPVHHSTFICTMLYWQPFKPDVRNHLFS